MQEEVIELRKLGPLPCSDDANVVVLKRFEELITSIRKPITDEEARVLVKTLGPDECYGLMWSLVGLIETAPGWPLADCLLNTSSEGVRLLRLRIENANRV
jgi:hypothetical protein